MTREERCFIEQLYIENFKKLYHYANIILQDSEASENIVNDTFVEAIKKAGCLFSHENPMGWLMQALKLNMKQYIRMQAKQPKIVPLDTVNEQLTVQTNIEEFDLLHYANLLSDEDRRLLELYCKKNYSHKEIAKEFGISVSASQKRMERIRKRLKIALEEK